MTKKHEVDATDESKARVAELQARLAHARERLDSLHAVGHIESLRQRLDHAIQLEDVAATEEASVALSAALAGTDAHGAQIRVAEAQIRRVEVELREAEAALSVAVRKALAARRDRLEAATIKAFREYAALVDEVTERYVRLGLIGEEYNAVEAASRGERQINHLPLAQYVQITPPGGHVPCISAEDRRERFGRAVEPRQPMRIAGLDRPWPGRELVERIRAEIAEI